MIVVGGGAAGLMAAWWAARGGADTLLLEGSKACGRKILISGGGRCNILPAESQDVDFHTQGSRNVLRRLFRTWPLHEVHAFLERELGLPFVVEEETGKVFPECQSARQVRDRLVERVAQAGVEVQLSWKLRELCAHADGFTLVAEDGERLHGEQIVLATGGRSVPKTGSDGSGYDIARSLGHTLLAPYPALVPLTSGDAELRELAGISLPVRWRARVAGKVVEERVRELLFTHRGFSGPAILDASHWVVRDGAELEVAWSDGSPEEWEDWWRTRGRRECARSLGDHLPRRLAELLCRRAGVRPETRAGSLKRGERDKLLKVLCAFRLPVDGDEGFRVAEVTGGGVPLGEVNPSTLESRKTPGLFVCGEILDVIGRIGGYNFLWAWVTGRLAGECAARAHTVC